MTSVIGPSRRSQVRDESVAIWGVADATTEQVIVSDQKSGLSASASETDPGEIIQIADHLPRGSIHLEPALLHGERLSGLSTATIAFMFLPSTSTRSLMRFPALNPSSTRLGRGQYAPCQFALRSRRLADGGRTLNACPDTC